MDLRRYLETTVIEDLKDKMVFVGGPRQVGKTTMAFHLLANGSNKHPAYLNWDVLTDRVLIQQGKLPSHQPLIVLDEIHKFARWRNLLKGFYDAFQPGISFLVTGSARLDHYRKGGDSLHGRYHYYRLHPLSLRECNPDPTPSDLRHLMVMGGFPEPFARGEERFLRRWRRERNSRVVHEDLRDLESVKEISLVELLVEALPRRVGSPLSVKNLSEDLQVAHDTVERWLTILDSLYLCFRLVPYGAPNIRAVKKERKLYLWDWTAIDDTGARFENFVACQLLKYCHQREDREGYTMELRYLRDTDKREVDFVVLEDGSASFAVECKSGQHRISPHVRYFKQRTAIPRFYQVHLGEEDYGDASVNVRVLPFQTFCRELDLP